MQVYAKSVNAKSVYAKYNNFFKWNQVKQLLRFLWNNYNLQLSIWNVCKFISLFIKQQKKAFIFFGGGGTSLNGYLFSQVYILWSVCMCVCNHHVMCKFDYLYRVLNEFGESLFWTGPFRDECEKESKGDCWRTNTDSIPVWKAIGWLHL